MEYAFRRSTPQSRLFRMAGVVLLHGVLIYGLTHALRPIMAERPSKSEIDVVILPQPELPKPAPTPVQRTQTTPTAPIVEVPVPEISIDVLPPAQTVTAQVAVTPGDSAPFVPPTSTSAGNGPPALASACPNSQSIRSNVRYPLAARRDGLEGDVVARFVVGANGAIRDIVIASSTNRAFNSTVVQAVAQFSCTGQGRDVAVEVPFSFRLN